jgi:Flp pilus assembly pilin Flp
MAMRLLAKIVALFRDKSAVTSTEYAVMLALLLGACTTAVNCLGQATRNTFTNVGNSVSGTGS